jgi:hypothetical protein
METQRTWHLNRGFARALLAALNPFKSLPVSSTAIQDAFFSAPTRLLLQIRKSISGSITNTSRCGKHSLPKTVKRLGKATTNDSLMERGEKFAHGKRLTL